MNIQKAIENGHLFIVDFPIKNDNFPLLCDSSPEGTILCWAVFSVTSAAPYPVPEGYVNSWLIMWRCGLGNGETLGASVITR